MTGPNDVATQVAGFVVILGAAVLIAILAERMRVPAAVALVAAGAFVQRNPPFAFGDTLLFVFLPPLIFEAAWNIDLAALRRMAWRVTVLAVPGTVATAFFVAGGLMLLQLFPFASALVFGAIVAATDPVAVVAAFRRVRVPADLRTLVEAESLSNDGVALVMFGFAVALAAGTAISAGDAVARGILQVAGGAAVGAVAGMVCAGVLRYTNTAEHEVTVTIVLAYVAYLAASSLHCSGIFATAGGAIVLRAALARRPATLDNAEVVDHVWGALAFVTNAAVFLATGLVIRPDRIAHEPVLVSASVVLVLLARLILALVALRDPAGRVTMFFAGMRGALPLALALSLPATLAARAQIIDATFAVVLVTIVLQGAALEHVLTRLYRDRPEAVIA